MKKSVIFSLLFAAFVGAAFAGDEYPLPASDIRIRDPFVYADPESKTYLMYAQTENRIGGLGAGVGVEMYASQDLEHFSEPQVVFHKEKDFWGGDQIWAPEMHRIGDWFYLFVTFNGREGGRGTQILRSRKAQGPFAVFSDQSNTPPEQCSLDGTPWIDETGRRWLVYCHEWVQIGDGAMRAVPMKGDFSGRDGESVLLFHASEAPWVKSWGGAGQGKYVTDGPCLYKTKNGKLLMLWSSFTGEGHTYAIGVAESESGKITGPWTQRAEPLFDRDGGHCMLFTTFEGQLTLALHQPNSGRNERAKFFPIQEEDGMLKVIAEQ
ncbi:MAG: family 43 glycosylhydrolase [Candidatus Omnitrophica bacterium]|nr:family 43 glycosylhydrolase [Candidatus Omnitrophota bacterium]